MTSDKTRENLIASVNIAELRAQKQPLLASIRRVLTSDYWSWRSRALLVTACFVIAADVVIWGLFTFGGWSVGYHMIINPPPPVANPITGGITFAIFSIIIPPTMLFLSVKKPAAHIRAGNPARAIFAGLQFSLFFVPWLAFTMMI